MPRVIIILFVFVGIAEQSKKTVDSSFFNLVKIYGRQNNLSSFNDFDNPHKDGDETEVIGRRSFQLFAKLVVPYEKNPTVQNPKVLNKVENYNQPRPDMRYRKPYYPQPFKSYPPPQKSRNSDEINSLDNDTENKEFDNATIYTEEKLSQSIQNGSGNPTNYLNSLDNNKKTEDKEPLLSKKNIPNRKVLSDTLNRQNGANCSCGVSHAKEKKGSLRIVGGIKVQPGTFPWMAALGYMSSESTVKYLCGGTLISNRHVLTAAHCINDELYSVALGVTTFKNKPSDGERFIKIIRKTTHPNYGNEQNDLALLLLEFPVTFSDSVQAICLPISPDIRSQKFHKLDKKAIVAGWGALHFTGDGVSSLMMVEIPIIDNEYCRKAYTDVCKVDDRIICAGYLTGGKDACQGDSGGPLMWRRDNKSSYYVVGVVSFGYKCAEPDHPGVYTNVAYFLDWILKTMKDD